mgnify:CR=1 FL=1
MFKSHQYFLKWYHVYNLFSDPTLELTGRREHHADPVKWFVKGSLFFSILQCCIYSLRITRTMKKPKYNDLVILYRKVDSVRKSSEQPTPKVLINFGVKQGIPWNFICAGIEHTEKIFTEAPRFWFIPDIAADYILFNFRNELKGVCHFLNSILVLSSSRDRSVPGLDLCLASLLSSSVIWLWGTGMVDSSEDMLSQISSTRRIFSGMDNFWSCGISITRIFFLLS